MKTFCCERCSTRVFFENVSCGACDAELGFIPAELAMGSFEPDGEHGLTRLSGKQGLSFRRCANHEGPVGCNWMVNAALGGLCLACRTTRVHPVLSRSQNGAYWCCIEAAKRLMAYSLVSWGLPFPCKEEDPKHGIAFDFLEQTDPGKKVLTGHGDGIITLNIAEADDARREEVRIQLHEPYRTLLGHLRHEIGHYYWDRLVRGTAWLDRFRALFGDERADYEKALKQHYARPVAHWQTQFVSAYASSHPWEDWAECWAHYMHLQDGLETAASWGLRLDQAVPGKASVQARPIASDEADVPTRVVKTWLPISQFINAMSRSLGGRDSYPFVMTDAVLDKLAFIHQVIDAGVKGDVPMNFGRSTASPDGSAAGQRACLESMSA